MERWSWDCMLSSLIVAVEGIPLSLGFTCVLLGANVGRWWLVVCLLMVHNYVWIYVGSTDYVGWDVVGCVHVCRLLRAVLSVLGVHSTCGGWVVVLRVPGLHWQHVLVLGRARMRVLQKVLPGIGCESGTTVNEMSRKVLTVRLLVVMVNVVLEHVLWRAVWLATVVVVVWDCVIFHRLVVWEGSGHHLGLRDVRWAKVGCSSQDRTGMVVVWLKFNI